jgi:hypothetical protein
MCEATMAYSPARAGVAHTQQTTWHGVMCEVTMAYSPAHAGATHTHNKTAWQGVMCEATTACSPARAGVAHVHTRMRVWQSVVYSPAHAGATHTYSQKWHSAVCVKQSVRIALSCVATVSTCSAAAAVVEQRSVSAPRLKTRVWQAADAKCMRHTARHLFAQRPCSPDTW